METITLGRTGVTVSKLGLGGGGRSRLGISAGIEPAESVAIVRRALELGITFIDTAQSYRTEGFVGEAIRDVPRDSVFISTKGGAWWHGERVRTPAELIEQVEGSLKRLGTDAIDLYSFHGTLAGQYASVRDNLVPELIRLREQGKIRFLGITERFNADPAHAMLSAAVDDDCWDVVMVGFNILNQSARERVLPRTLAKGIATQAMFVVRNAFSRPERLAEVIAGLIEDGRIDPADVDPADPLGFLLEDGVATSLADASYRFCRDEPGMDVVLTGTGSTEHLEANVASMARPPLPEATRDRLRRIFQGVDCVTAQ